MALVIDNVIIPTDVANALTLNGVDITSLTLDDILVWVQQLFSATWSGDSISYDGGNWHSLDTSGSLFRHNSGQLTPIGDWVSVNSLGVFESKTSRIGSDSVYSDITGSSNNLNASSYLFAVNPSVGTVTFTVGSGFSGSSYGDSGGDKLPYLETSGGSIRYTYQTGVYSAGSWITLT